MVHFAFKHDLVIVIVDDHGEAVTIEVVVLEANNAVVFEVRTHHRRVTQICLESFSEDKPIGASPRRNEDGNILVCSTYSTYTVLIGTTIDFQYI
jgi:hypothetical protein